METTERRKPQTNVQPVYNSAYKYITKYNDSNRINNNNKNKMETT